MKNVKNACEYRPKPKQHNHTSPDEWNQIGLELFGQERIEPQTCLTKMDYDGSATELRPFSTRIGRTFEQFFFFIAKKATDDHKAPFMNIRKNSTDN
ncbi:hypothetical protein CCB80_10605 [Armatimonadetes bacterium Uphvl-Ar1]|nr:hypothetical protein CCB80_10605 [Armatimonadetes bacterium Uphvl-Ar1]